MTSKQIYLVLLLEGFAVLAAEMVAIRQIIPFAGAGADSIAIVIASVLLPLSIGYYKGGQFVPYKNKKGEEVGYRKKLIMNVTSASIVLALGLSYFVVELFFLTLMVAGLTIPVLQLTVYVLVFLVYPTYLLAQTLPLISHYIESKDLSESAGRMLSISTLGSLLGSVFTSVVLMVIIGVNGTVVAVIVSLFLAVILLNKRGLMSSDAFFVGCVVLAAIILNHPKTLEILGVVEQNRHNTIAVTKVPDEEDTRMLVLNRSSASKVTPNREDMFPYWTYIHDNFITYLVTEESPEPKKVLVLGAGGFTVGMDDPVNHYTYIDIDDRLDDISEKYFLKKPLNKNQHFVAKPARNFLMQDTQHYELIVIDLFNAKFLMPFQLLTVEFFEAVKKRLAPNGVIVVNSSGTTNFSNDFTRNYDATLRTVFPFISRIPLHDRNPFDHENVIVSNVLYVYYGYDDVQPVIYTDNKNRSFLDQHYNSAYDRKIERKN